VGFFARLRGTNDEQRSLPRPDNELPLYGAYTATTVTPAAALAIGDVWSAVRVLADAASSLPLHVYRKTSDRREPVTSGRLVDLLEQPGPCTSQADLISSLMAHLAIYGAGYIGKYRENGEIVQLALLHPDHAAGDPNGLARAGTCAGAREKSVHNLRLRTATTTTTT